MLTSEHAGPARAAEQGATSTERPRPRAGRSTPRALRAAAVVLGLLGALLAVAVPLLPVVQQTAVVEWPTAGDVSPVGAPLVAYQPESMTASVPCETARALDGRRSGASVVVATAPLRAADAEQVGLYVRVDGGVLTVVTRGQVLVSEPLPATPCVIDISSTTTATTVAIDGERIDTGPDQDVRPQVSGVYTDLVGTLDPVDGLAVAITVDTRFDSTAHPVKLAAIALAVVCVLASLLVLHRIDAAVGRRAPRLAPRGWWRPTPRDGAVVGVLATWVVIGGATSDDGYILTMAQAREASGYVGNYYRWFHVPEAPFGWFYEVYALWAEVSTSPVWLRVPSLLMALVCWLLISRQVMPRLGREVRRSAAAGWAAAAVFLAFWLPYDNGLRPEPVVAVGSLLTLCAVERCVVTRRLAPLALALLVAALTVAATPTGFIAVAPFLVAVRPILRLLRAHAAASGWVPTLAPVLGAGLLVLVVVFADQPLEAVLEATRVRTFLGPSLGWYEEPARYLELFSLTANGSPARRFPVLLLLLSVLACSAVLLRRGHIPGAATGPARRLIGVAAISLALIALTPTKWSHHFGAFAAIGASLAALTALASSSTVLRARRNRMAFLAALLLVVAVAVTAPNAQWYGSGFGVPWGEDPPALAGVPLSTVLLLAAAVAAAVSVVETLRTDVPGAPPDRPERRRRGLRLGAAPLAVVCGLVVLAQLAGAVIGIVAQRGSYSLGAANARSLAGGSCNLSDAVLVESDPADGVLPVAADADEPAQLDGFAPDALPEEGEPAAEGELGVLPPTAPFGLGAAGPVWGSYLPDGPGVGELTTPWFEVPDAVRAGETPLAVAVAGHLGFTTPVFAEFASSGGDPLGELPLVQPRGAPEVLWRDVLVEPSGAVAGADLVRLRAEDRDSTVDGWIALTAPRAPQLRTLTEVAGDQPVFFDWPVGFLHPCLRPAEIRHGIAEVPAYRLLPDEALVGQSLSWSAGINGGPLGWLQLAVAGPATPTYLDGAEDEDWGELQTLSPRGGADAAPTVRVGEAVRAGWWSPGTMRTVEPDLTE